MQIQEPEYDYTQELKEFRKDKRRIIVAEHPQLTEQSYNEIIKPFKIWLEKVKVLGHADDLEILIQNDDKNSIILTLYAFNNTLLIPKELKHISLSKNMRLAGKLIIQNIDSLIIDKNTYVFILNSINKRNMTNIEVSKEIFPRLLFKTIELLKEQERFNAETFGAKDWEKGHKAIQNWTINNYKYIPDLIYKYTKIYTNSINKESESLIGNIKDTCSNIDEMINNVEFDLTQIWQEIQSNTQQLIKAIEKIIIAE